ncbi:MAG: lipopolysaccharide transport periplasmic protein LptA [Endozoicomonadaceae bacterium]|nr:lipopolysaccharide transport periplasmic protein LptA [Endozoicomonadaceae bacterium]MCY4329851.1 lipopolysaccharide transport periplasmic protein LptA [Endozoicomonadaceae bacterium]
MSYKKFNTVAISFFIIFQSLSVYVQALKSDKEKPLYCSADSVVVDQNADTSVFTGNVKMTQGSVQVKGNIVKLYTQDKKIAKIVVLGNKKQQAYYAEEEDNNQGLVKAWADAIIYDIKADIIKLEDNVTITRPNETLTGKFIQYDKEKRRVNAYGDNEHKQQVEIILQPQVIKSSLKPKKK